MSAPIFLKGGTLLIHDDADHVVPTKADLLIQDTKIAAIGKDIKIPPGAKVIDCTDKIISPGFIDTHRHVWQTQLKGRHGDHTLLQYFPPGNSSGSCYEPEDVFWGQLAGHLESIDAGTTTVLDFAHISNTPEHVKQAINGTIASGIRSVFCYTPTPGYSYSPAGIDWSNLMAPWVMETWDALSTKPLSDGKLVMGFGFDGLAMPGEMLKPMYAHLREKGVKVITSHGVGGAMFGNGPSALDILDSHGLLAPDILIAHATPLTPTHGPHLAKSGAHISSTPSVELLMGHGDPIALDPAIYPHASLGIDCHSATSAFLPAEMRSLLFSARAAVAQDRARARTWARSVGDANTVERVFNLGTVLGARALGLEGAIGRIAEGFRADLSIWDANSPGLLAAAVHDPVAALVLHGSVRDVEGVIVDGVVRKADGRLVDVQSVGEEGVLGSKVGAGAALEGKTLTWADVAREVVRSRAAIEKKLEGVDYRATEDGLVDLYHMNRADMVEK